MDGDKTIKVRSNDGVVEELTNKAAERSTLLKGVIEDYPENSEFPLNNVNAKTLKKIKEYLDHYKDKDPKPVERPLKSLNFKECVDEWDYNFLDLDIDSLFELVNGANYMDIKPLLEILSAKIGCKIKNITTETIRNEFDIHDKFTPEEEEQILKDKSILEKNL